MEELLQRCFDGILGAGESEELLEIWDRSPDLLDHASEHYRIEHLLAFILKQKKQPISFGLSKENATESDTFQDLFGNLPPIDPARLAAMAEDILNQEKQSLAEPEAGRVSTPYRPKEKNAKKRRKTFLSLDKLIVAAIFTIGAVGYWRFQHDSSQNDRFYDSFRPFAKVSAVSELFWPENETPLKLGQELEAKRICFDSGLMELELSNGVRIVLEGPVDFQLNSESKTFCNGGRISAAVPPSGKGFEVATPLLSVVDLGTEFYLDVRKEYVETHTISGKTELNRLRTKKVPLTQGKAFQIDPEGKTKNFNADAALFVSHEKAEREMRNYERQKRSRWQIQTETLNADPGLLVHFDFEETTVFNRSLRGRTLLPEGRRAGGRSKPGRWTEKQSIEFRNRGDYLDLNLPGEYRSMTLAASVRIDQLDRFNHTILASRGDGPGSLLWQLGRDGGLQLSIQPDSKRPPFVFTANRAFLRSQWKTWCQLATVVDAKNNRVVHYVDGREVGRFDLAEPLPIRLGEATLGNGFWRVKTKTDRSLNGRIDQLMIFERPLSTEELEKFAGNTL